MKILEQIYMVITKQYAPITDNNMKQDKNVFLVKQQNTSIKYSKAFNKITYDGSKTLNNLLMCS